MYGHIHVLCSQFLKENGVDPLFLIWDSLASAAEGKTSAGLATIQKITNRLAMGLPISVAQLCIHKMAKNQDFASITQLENEIDELQKSANASMIVQAAQIFWLTGDLTTALNLVQPLTTQAPANKSAAALVGWIKLTTGDRNSGRWFDMAAAESSTTNRPADPFVIYGKAMYYASASRWQDSIQIFVQLSGMCEFPEIALERARVYICMNNWDLAMESCAEATGKCISDCEEHLINSIFYLSQVGDLESAKKSVNSLCDCIDRFEIENSTYCLNVVKLLSSLSWDDIEIVRRCLTTFGVVARSHKEDAEVLVMHGRLLFSMKKPLDAKDVFQNALVASSESMDALAGLVDCYISTNQLSDAHDQLEFLEAMAGGNVTLDIAYMHSKYMRISSGTDQESVDSLINALKKHVDNMQQLFTPQSARMLSEDKAITHPIDLYIENFIKLDLGTFSSALTEVINYCNTLEKTVTRPRNGPVCDIIANVLELVPGAIPFSYYLAVLAFGEGRYQQATKAIMSVLQSRWGFNASQCHLLLAQVRLQTKQFDEAEASLNRAVSFDFGIRNSLRFNMINAQLNEARGQFENAIKTLKDVMKGQEYQSSSDNEKVNVYLFLSRCQKKNNEIDMAMSTISEALTKWSGTPDEDRIKLYQAKILSDTNRVREGLDILEAIDSNSTVFTQARKKAAKIYMNKLNDKAAYIRCFKELGKVNPNKTTYVLLGDAFMNVKMFNDAVDCFNKAISCDPTDQQVALHLARALMTVHDFEAALAAYNHAIKVGLASSNSNNDINSMNSGPDMPSIQAQLELCRTLIKLRRLDEARDSCLEAMQLIDVDRMDWESQSANAEFSELLSEIDSKSGDIEQSNEEIQEALSIYDRLLTEGRTDIPSDYVNELKAKAASLYQRYSNICLERDDKKNAIEALEKALQLDQTSNKILLSLARLRLQRNEREKCQEICQQLLRIDPNCEEAALMIAEVSEAEGLSDLEEAFNKTPTFYRTLVRLIERYAQEGQLDLIPPLFEKCPNKEDAGLNFCRGLYNVYTGNPQNALKILSKCRNDSEWGPQSLQLIFMIYVNPNQKFNWCETKPLATSKDLDAAKKVLTRFDPTQSDIQQLRAMLLLSANTTESVTEALEIFKEGDDEDLNAMIGKCKCFIRLDQQREATKLLNGIVHGEPDHMNVSIYVEAFLMMTYISIKEQQPDEAEKYVDKALELNKSCNKAWELKAALCEKKKDYLNAVDAYKHAWDLSSHTQLGTGFKLALNYMRMEDPVDAIKVCRIIMETHPNYPKLKETIFLPCCAMLRP